MKNKFLYPLLVFFFTGILFSSCIKKPVYPSEPVIAYKDFLRYGNPSSPDSVALVVSFTDNEGDIGLGQSDTNGIFKFGNFWMIYFWWDAVNNKWNVVDTDPGTPAIDTLKIPYRVPIVLPKEDSSEPVKGLIYAKQNPFLNPYKRIKYEVFMYDKAMHKSNVIETPPLDF
jgi:hypothetical protein